MKPRESKPILVDEERDNDRDYEVAIT